MYAGDFSPDVRPIAAMRARVLDRAGELGDALGWAREPRPVGRRRPQLPARVRARHPGQGPAGPAPERARRATRRCGVGLLQRLLPAAEAGGRTGSAIEILVLQALAQQHGGDIPAALAPLGRALTLAEPEGYVRVFVDEGPPMAALLEAAAQRGIAPDYVRRLLAAARRHRATATSTVGSGLVEPLSGRELDVLRLLATDLGGPDIARELVVSLNTVRTHTKNIYAKLGVNNRRAAVRRAQELDILR